MTKAFTLIELLIVIAVIGVLSTIVAVSYPNYTKRARDTQRKSDLKQYQVALETYANQHSGVYPAGSGRLNSIITGGPEDPGGTNYYQYLPDASNINYVIWGKLESKTNTYWISCANGRVGESATVPSDTSCSTII